MSTSVQWRDLTLATGPDAAYRITSIDGWEARPPARYDNINRARGHGSHRSPVWADQRIVTAEGFTWSQDDRDRLLADLEASAAFGDGEEPLTITMAGRTLTASTQLIGASPTVVAGEWGIGKFGWALQWRCPDPLRYGPAQPPQSVGLPSSSGGLVYPLTYPLTYGTAGSSGQITLVNDGTADAPIQAQIVGPLPQGWEISAAGQRITYPVFTPAGQTQWLDTAAGSLLVEGTSERNGDLSHADWPLVPKGGSLTLQFISLGGDYDPAARLTVPGFRAAFW